MMDNLFTNEEGTGPNRNVWQKNAEVKMEAKETFIIRKNQLKSTSRKVKLIIQY